MASTRYKYTGKEKDATGLYYYGARHYDPALGRFMSADSVLPNAFDPQQLNRYAYVRNNPIRLVDPDGHDAAEPQWLAGFHGWMNKNVIQLAREVLGPVLGPISKAIDQAWKDSAADEFIAATDPYVQAVGESGGFSGPLGLMNLPRTAAVKGGEMAVVEGAPAAASAVTTTATKVVGQKVTVEGAKALSSGKTLSGSYWLRNEGGELIATDKYVTGSMKLTFSEGTVSKVYGGPRNAGTIDLLINRDLVHYENARLKPGAVTCWNCKGPTITDWSTGYPEKAGCPKCGGNWMVGSDPAYRAPE